MIFDVETTGLLPRPSERAIMEKWPHILQLSYVLYPSMRSVNHYIKIDPSVTISPEITAINGCTPEKSKNGTPIEEVLMEFYRDFHKSEMVIAHNFAFDADVILHEFQRHWSVLQTSCPHALVMFSPDYLETLKIKPVCTMKATIDLCKLPFRNARPGSGYKYPTLAELHRHLFQSMPLHLHDSSVDVLVTLRCFLMLKGQRVDDAAFAKWSAI